MGDKVARTTGKRAAIYKRVSTDEQSENGRGWERQERNCLEYVLEHGCTVVEILADDCSGTIEMSERPAGGRLFEMARGGEIDLVVADTVCRVSRPKFNEAEFIVLRCELAKLGVELVTCDMPSTGDAFADNIIGLAKAKGAKEEREKLIARSKEGKLDKARAGKWVGNGNVPFGFRREGSKQTARLVIYEPEAELMRRIFGWAVGPDGSRPMPLRKIAIKLTEEGVPTPSGNHKLGKGWTANTVRRVLRNSACIGEFRYAAEIVCLPELAIIDRVTFEMARDQLRRNQERATRNGKRQYLLSGHIKCACGLSMHGFTTWKDQNTYYQCTSAVAGRYLSSCRERMVRAATADPLVWNWLYNLMMDDAQLDEGLREMSARREADLAPKRQRLETLDELIGKAERRIRRLVAEFEDDEDETVTAELRVRRKEAIKHKDALLAERERLQGDLEQIEIARETRLAIKSQVAKIRGMLDGAAFEDKRYLLDILDVQARLCRREDGRWLYVTCGIVAEGVMLKLKDGEGASHCGKREQLPQSGIELRSY